MFISRLDGGLGNQMFQYAYGCYLASKYETELLLDLDSFANQPPHGYLLHRFQINASVLSPTQSHLVPRRYRPEISKRGSWSGLVWNRLAAAKMRRHKEKPFGFQPQHLAPGNNRYLVGYWQSEKFFPGMRESLLQQFRLREQPSPKTLAIAESMQATNSIALHIRRGDYLNNPEAARLYHNLESNYYRRCVEQWSEQHANPQVYIFSNDPQWCSDNVTFDHKTHFVDHNDASTAHEDLFLISQARCCVVANSTFSWWGAWLNQRADKSILAPDTWFQPQTLDGSSIIPKSWSVVSIDRHAQAA